MLPLPAAPGGAPAPTDVAGADPGGERVVLDTNAWLDLYVFADAAAQGLRAALGRGALIAVRSQRTDAELEAVLQRPAFAARCDGAQAAGLLQDWRTRAHEFDAQRLRSAPWACRDPDDQKFLDLAVSAGAAWLITKDRALLDLARRARGSGLQIATPARFAAGVAV